MGIFSEAHEAAMATVEAQLKQARDFAWHVFTFRPMPECSWTFDMRRMFETWRAEGWSQPTEYWRPPTELAE